MTQLRTPINGLLSYWYAQDADVEAIARDYRLIGDCGAFSAMSVGARIDIDAYAAWVKQWGDFMYWAASLDVIDSVSESLDNYRHLRDVHGLDVVPTVHWREPLETIDAYVQDGATFIGLGGLASTGYTSGKLAWCLAMFKYAKARHPEVKFHGWGVFAGRLVRPLPWYSVDSSRYVRGVRRGLLSLFDPTTGGFFEVRMNGHHSHHHALVLRDHYGVEPALVESANPVTRRDVLRVAARSFQLFEDHLRKRRAIEPPSYGITNPVAVGPLVHVVPGLPSEFQVLL